MVIEDHPISRLGLHKLINQETDLIVYGEAEDKIRSCSVIQRLNPDLMIIDLSPKDGDGINLIKDISRNYKNMRVLIFSMNNESIFAECSLNDGAKGYINKR
jgi:DNA-binding NarL/FixJ family response regulator